jgi:hypothetical protein
MTGEVRLEDRMPKGPNGEQRPADVAQCAHKVFQIAIGEAEDKGPSRRRKSGLAGAAARAKTLSGERRSQIAKKAAAARWS